MTRTQTYSAAAIALVMAAAATAARADTVLAISDSSGNIGQVDVTKGTVVAGSVHATGQTLTDLAENGGTLYGTTGSTLYTVDPASGTASSVGSYAVGLGFNNALTGSGADLLTASLVSKVIYAFSPSTPGTATTYATSPLASAGALAFAGGTLYESGLHGRVDALVNVGAGTYADFHVGSPSGTTVSNVYGLADDGSALYALAGTEVYTVNTATAVLAPLFSYGGAGLGNADGTAVLPAASAVPEPATLTVLGLGLVGVVGVSRLGRRTA